MAGYDVIGDVHGQYEMLVELLGKLGYRKWLGAWRHPEGRTAVFVGDLIDRGPRQREVVELVRRMVEAGSALVVMGNHEFNAIGFATPAEDGSGFLRPHSAKNRAQHRAFLDQFGWDTPLLREVVAWFRTLPIALDLGGIRVCHACWHPESIEAVAEASDENGRIDDDWLRAAFRKGERAYEAMKALTKGLEIALPDGSSFVDHDGFTRTEARFRWWQSGAATYRAAAIVPDEQRHNVPDTPLPGDVVLGNPSPVPVFVGHYWLTTRPAPQNANTAVVDYGAGIEGPLVAYRWEGEPEIARDGFVAVGGRERIPALS